MVCLQETLKKERQVDQPDQPCLSLDDALELTDSAVETCLSWWSGFPQESGPPVPEGLSLSSSVYRLLRTWAYCCRQTPPFSSACPPREISGSAVIFSGPTSHGCNVEHQQLTNRQDCLGAAQSVPSTETPVHRTLVAIII